MARSHDSQANPDPPNAAGQVDIYLTLLKECGVSLRSTWDVMNSFVRNFLYVNMTLFGAFILLLKNHGGGEKTRRVNRISEPFWKFRIGLSA